MPFYSYTCSNCSFTFEESKKVDERDEPTKKPCPSCNEIGTVTIQIAPVNHKWNCSLPTNS